MLASVARQGARQVGNFARAQASDIDMDGTTAKQMEIDIDNLTAAARASSSPTGGGAAARITSRDFEQAVKAQLPQPPQPPSSAAAGGGKPGKRSRSRSPDAVAKAAAAQQQQQQQQQQQRVTSQREARRETAKRSRQRKKFVVQSLETLRGDMERRNTALAAAVVAHLPSRSPSGSTPGTRVTPRNEDW